MHHSEYEIGILAEQRHFELIAEAKRLNQLHDCRRRQHRRWFQSLLNRVRRPAPDRPVIDLREQSPTGVRS